MANNIPQSKDLNYDPVKLESKWQSRWSADKLYKVDDSNIGDKWYELTMYPYPSGDLHIGHWYAMAPSDAHARFKRMQGYNVLHPMGFDAFGLPAENAAIKEGIHPRIRTMENIQNMRRQLRSMGTIYDWDREIYTCSPEYYRWTQWMFLQFYKAGLAYRANAPANWCPKDNTVLANEQVLEGKCERCDSVVERRELNQWFFRITDYAEELLDYSQLDWPDKITTMQTNWIGRSEGVEIQFDISEYGLEEKVLETFTTRIDTIFGVTFVAMAPEHPLVLKLTTSQYTDDVKRYIENANKQSEIERLSTEKEKTGVFTGAYCVNQLNDERVPIFVADYVLLTYGTGVVMAVPAHDQRDFEFAEKYKLSVKIVVAPPDWDGSKFQQAYVDQGFQVNSCQFNNIPSIEAVESIADYIVDNGFGRRTVGYRMRDWLISRQRYWGTPIPIIYCDECGTVPVHENQLPVLLPDDAEFRPTGESPLMLHQDFLNTECPNCGKAAVRETDTMDTFVDSSWYQFRFTSPNYNDGAFDPVAVKEWAPVDQYTGGAEHAVMHLLYARFFTKVLRDLGLINFDEPFIRLFNQGHIIADHQKMSKSRGNVIAPDDYVDRVGADVVRCYLMFLGPWDQGGDWSDSGLKGMARWMNRIWELANRDPRKLDQDSSDQNASKEVHRLVHKTIRRVTEDLSKFKFNTALAALMEMTNAMSKFWDDQNIARNDWLETIEKLTLLVAPMAPHIAEEIWQIINQEYSIHNQKWPDWDPKIAADEVFTMVVQVNGKLRDRIEVPVSINESDARTVALSSERVSTYISGKELRRVIYVPGKLLNIVTQ